MNKKLKILVIVNNLGAVAQVRLLSPLKYLKINGYIEYEVADLSKNKSNPVTYVPDIVIIQRLNDLKYYNFIQFLKEKGSKIIFELDDNLLEIPPSNPAYGLLEDPSRKRAFLEYIWLSDFVTVSTENLKSYYSRFNENIIVLPNQIDEEIFINSSVKKTNPSKIRIGFAGTVTHREDFEQVEEGLKDILQKYSNRIELVFLNMIPEKFVEEKNVQFIPGVSSLHEYSKLLVDANLDIGLAPLSFNKFNMAKSDIKFLEYAISGIAGIYSNFGPYKRAIKNGQNGLLVHTENSFGWFSQINYLIENPHEIDNIKSNSFEFVSANRVLQKSHINWLDAFYKVTSKKWSKQNVKNFPKSSIPDVSIICVVQNEYIQTQNCISAIFTNDNSELNIEMILVDNNSTDETSEYLDRAEQIYPCLKIIRVNKSEKLSKLKNIAAKQAKSNNLLFIENHIEPQKDWLNELLNKLNDSKNNGIVGGKLLFKDNSIFQTGIELLMKNDKQIDIKFVNYGRNSSILYNDQSENLSVVTSECLLITRNLFEEVSGYDESYKNDYDDIDLCLKVHKINKSVVVQNASNLYVTKVFEGPQKKKIHNDDYVRFNKNWATYILNIQDQENKIITSKCNAVEQDIKLTSLIVLTHNQLKYTQEFISSIRESTTNYELIIIDNNSTDGTKKYLESVKMENLNLIFNEKNVGFPKGINQGILASKGDYIIIANNDIVVTKNWLDRLIIHAESDKRIGIVGPISNFVSGVQLDKTAQYDSIEEMHKYASKVAKKNFGQIDEFPRVAFLCTLIKRELINKIGGLDERFSPGNFEDDDYCLRAQFAGYKTIIAKDVFVHHYGSVSFKEKGEEEYAKRLETNENIFIDKWGGNPEAIWLRGERAKSREFMVPLHEDIFCQSLARAFVNIDDEEYDHALNNLKLAIDNYKNSPRSGYENISLEDLLSMAGNISLTKNELEGAKTYFEKQLEQNPNSSNACFGLGEVFRSAEMLNESKTMYEWALANDNENSIADIRLREINSKLNLPEDHNTLLEENEMAGE